MRWVYALIVLGVVGILLGAVAWVWDPPPLDGSAGVGLVETFVAPLMVLAGYGGAVLLTVGLILMAVFTRRTPPRDR